MKHLLASAFRQLFAIPYFKDKYFGLYKRVFRPWQLFNGVHKTVRYRHGLLLRLHLADWIPQHLYFLGDYEERGILFLEQHLRPGHVVLDVGANMGLYSLVASKMVGGTGQVYAFEPLPANADLLREHIAINRLSNVQLEQKAVSNVAGLMPLYTPPPNNSGMASLRRYSDELGAPVQVEVVTLDAYAESLPAVHLIKLDIEGGEYQALLGMQRLLARHKPLLMLELQPNILGAASQTEFDIRQLLSALGYRQYFVDKQGRLTHDTAAGVGFHNVVFVPA
ncbi:FkbM family methyltransferase [Solirubrum puertoriconensis]|uniref:Methyltransferase FkbM domain-containing protein n=1 Tax=Solirubrum puertoriconensis TaxID=1751427 RepID=A0A9X0HKD1_SOLP1|nr:FkbM family methyltransferase [Solirubrum puertoriconensis]KUG07531.1 hypothetical protein ASU33_14425 [Solirubrum puertoriconensis]